MSEEKCEKYSDGKTHIRKGFCTDYFWRDCSDVEECVYKLKQQLQTAKEENEKLTQQNKQMREALSWLETLLRENYNDKENQINCVAFAYEKIQQSLNEVNNEK